MELFKEMEVEGIESVYEIIKKPKHFTLLNKWKEKTIIYWKYLYN